MSSILELVPKIMTKRIIISVGSENSSTEYVSDIDVLIKERDDYSWFQAGDYKNYIRFHILEIRNNSSLAETIFKKCYKPEKRMSEIKKIVQSTANLSDQSMLEITSLKDCLNKLDAHSMAVCHVSKTLSEIINEFSEAMTSVTMSDLMPTSNPAGDFQTSPADYLCTFSIRENLQITDDQQIPRLREFQEPEDLRYITFCQLDVEQLLLDHSIDPTVAVEEIEDLNSIGGPMTYDIALRDGVVPSTKSVFVSRIDPSVVWTGPVHIRSQDSVFGTGPDGYEGYMSGFEPSPNSQKLIKKTVKNSKIKFFQEMGISTNYSPDPTYCDERHRKQYPITVPGIHQGLGVEYAFTSIQSALDQITRERVELTRKQIQDSTKSILSSIYAGAGLTSFMEISKTSTGIAHMILSIDYANLIKNYSKYGYFFDVDEQALMSGNEIKKEFLRRSKILSFKIFRKRVTDRPNGIGYFGYNEHKEFDTEETPKLIVHSNDNDDMASYRGNLETSIYVDPAIVEGEFMYPIGTVQEFDLVLPEEPDGTRYRSFECYDFSLSFVNDGTYTYELEIVVQDGIKEVLLELEADYRAAISQLKSLVEIARIPSRQASPREHHYYNFTNFGDGDINNIAEESPVIGSYNYKTRQYTTEFLEKCRAEHLTDSLNLAVSKYYNLMSILSFSKQNNSPDSQNSAMLNSSAWWFAAGVAESINPLNGGIFEDLEKFYFSMVGLGNVFSEIINSKDIMSDMASMGSSPTGRLPGSKTPNIIKVTRDYKKSISAGRPPLSVPYFNNENTTYQEIHRKWREDQSTLNDSGLSPDRPLPIILPLGYFNNFSLLTPTEENNTEFNYTPIPLTIPLVPLNFTIPLSGIITQHRSLQSDFLINNKVFAVSDLRLLDNSRLGLIKNGLDMTLGVQVAQSLSKYGQPFRLPLGVYDYYDYLNGVSAGLLGFGIGQAYRKFVLDRNTLTHDNFNALVCDAVYLSGINFGISKSLVKTIKERKIAINQTGFLSYVESLKKAVKLKNDYNFSGNPYSLSKKNIRNPKQERESFNDPRSEDILHKYITSNPAALKIKTKISGENQNSNDSYKNYSFSMDNNNDYAPGNLSSRKNKMTRKVLMKVEPVRSNNKNLGHVHDSDNSELVNDILLVEI